MICSQSGLAWCYTITPPNPSSHPSSLIFQLLLLLPSHRSSSVSILHPLQFRRGDTVQSIVLLLHSSLPLSPPSARWSRRLRQRPLDFHSTQSRHPLTSEFSRSSHLNSRAAIMVQSYVSLSLSPRYSFAILIVEQLHPRFSPHGRQPRPEEGY